MVAVNSRTLRCPSCGGDAWAFGTLAKCRVCTWGAVAAGPVQRTFRPGRRAGFLSAADARSDPLIHDDVAQDQEGDDDDADDVDEGTA